MSPEKNHTQRKLETGKAPEYHGHRCGLPHLKKCIQFFILKSPQKIHFLAAVGQPPSPLVDSEANNYLEYSINYTPPSK